MPSNNKDNQPATVTTASLSLALKKRWEKLKASSSFKNFNQYVNYAVIKDIEEREKLERMGVIVRPPRNDVAPPE